MREVLSIAFPQLVLPQTTSRLCILGYTRIYFCRKVKKKKNRGEREGEREEKTDGENTHICIHESKKLGKYQGEFETLRMTGCSYSRMCVQRYNMCFNVDACRFGKDHCTHAHRYSFHTRVFLSHNLFIIIF